MSLSDEKAAARKSAFARRKTADPALADVANAHLLEAVQSAPGLIVSGYWPIRTEIDPRPTLTALAASHTICLPVVAGPGLPLLFRRWRPGDPMEDADFGISVPADPVEITPEILIVPLAAFDAKGFRLGYGGGFYDRTLAKLRRTGPVTAIGFAYEAQKSDAVPHEATDQPLDLIVTERGVLRP